MLSRSGVYSPGWTRPELCLSASRGLHSITLLKHPGHGCSITLGSAGCVDDKHGHGMGDPRANIYYSSCFCLREDSLQILSSPHITVQVFRHKHHSGTCFRCEARRLRSNILIYPLVSACYPKEIHFMTVFK